MRKRTVNREVIYKMPEFIAGNDHIVARFYFGNSSFGVRFLSPEHLLIFTQQLLETASKVWPDNEWIKEYNNETD